MKTRSVLFKISLSLAILCTVWGFANAPSTQLIPTSLRITVLDNLGNYIQDAEVQIYDDQAQYKVEGETVRPAQMTNGKGRVTFKKLDPTVYYLRVTKGDMNNDGLAVATDSLTPKYINQVNVIIE